MQVTQVRGPRKDVLEVPPHPDRLSHVDRHQQQLLIIPDLLAWEERE